MGRPTGMEKYGPACDTISGIILNGLRTYLPLNRSLPRLSGERLTESILCNLLVCPQKGPGRGGLKGLPLLPLQNILCNSNNNGTSEEVVVIQVHRAESSS
jgi:hypothetical protein